MCREFGKCGPVDAVWQMLGGERVMEQPPRPAVAVHKRVDGKYRGQQPGGSGGGRCGRVIGRGHRIEQQPSTVFGRRGYEPAVALLETCRCGPDAPCVTATSVRIASFDERVQHHRRLGVDHVSNSTHLLHCGSALDVSERGADQRPESTAMAPTAVTIGPIPTTSPNDTPTLSADCASWYANSAAAASRAAPSARSAAAR